MPKPVEESFFAEFEETQKPVKKAKPRKAKAAAPDNLQPSDHPRGEAPVSTKPVIFQAPEKARDWEFEEAIRALEPLMSEESRAEFAYILDPFYNNAELKARYDQWRLDHGILG